MSLVCAGCSVIAPDIDGEYTCVRCGRVYGAVEVAGIEEQNSHYVYLPYHEQGSKPIGRYTYKLSIILNLPQFALETIIRVANDLVKEKVTQKQALLFATIYTCREYSIPRSLSTVLDAMRQLFGKEIVKSPPSLLKMLNKTSRKAYELGYKISAPDKYYYLQAYLAKIQDTIVRESNTEYYEYLRTRTFKHIKYVDGSDPSHVARDAIVSNTCRTLQGKVRKLLTGDMND
jgi:hypothetical protein